jgi:general nucleoside transport system permease protein
VTTTGAPIGGPGVPAPTGAPADLEAAGRRLGRAGRILLIAGGALVLIAAIGRLTGAPELTSSGTFAAAVRLGAPIMLAGLGGVFAERVGVVNIGLEGMMILGTWFGAYTAWLYGPWWGVLGAVLGGAAGGLLHALATVTFGVDHIVSGVAINILAGGVARFLSVISFTPDTGGGATQSPRIAERIGRMNVPFLAGGDVFGWQSPDLFGWLERTRVFIVADVAAILRALTTNLSWLIVLSIALIFVSWYLLWGTPLGLRMRSVGEHPVAAESVGVRVYTMKYIGVTISGALAGLGGAILVLEAAGIYREGQTGGRGFIGLAAMIFGNWRPGGAAAAASIFGYASALQLRDETAVHGLLLFVAVTLFLAAAFMVWRRSLSKALALALIGGLFLFWWISTDAIPRQFIFFTPHVTTLVVLAFASQRLRMPAADGMRYRRGQSV